MLSDIEIAQQATMKRITPLAAERLGISEEHLGTPGEAWLFAQVLDRFVSRTVSLNSFTQLTVTGARHGEVHAFPPRLGGRILL